MDFLTNFNQLVIQPGTYNPISAGGKRRRRNRNRSRRHKKTNKSRTRRHH
jgi:hypothetical protein